MKSKDFKRQVKRLRRLAKKWAEPLGLGDWRITQYNYDDNESRRFERGDDYAMFVTYAAWQYKHATIEAYIPEVERMDDSALEEYYIHELMHIHLNEMREEGKGHEDRVATQLAKAFRWVRSARL
jgi:hypothetical protein